MAEQPISRNEEHEADVPEVVQAPELFTFHDTEGGQQIEVAKILDQVLIDLKKEIPELGGISIVGSTFRGYAKPHNKERDGSDADICLIVDKDVSYTEEDLEKLVRIADSFYLESMDKYGIAIEVLGVVNISNLNITSVINNPTGTLRPLVFPIYGDEGVSEKGNKAVKEIIDANMTTGEQKDQWAERFAKDLVDRYIHVDKPMSRVGLNPSIEEEVIKFKNDQYNLYLSRIKGLFL
jgi:predicted nucleotidyltransferase